MSVGARIDPADGWLVGEDKQLVFRVVTDNGAAVDCTGWTATWSLFAARAKPGATPIVTVTGIIGAADQFVVGVPAAATAGLTAGTYEHTLRRTDPGSLAYLAYDSVALGAAP